MGRWCGSGMVGDLGWGVVGWWAGCVVVGGGRGVGVEAAGGGSEGWGLKF